MNEQISAKAEKALNLILTTKLFSGIDEKNLSLAIESGSFSQRCYEAGETICSPADKERKMVIFLSGEAEIYTADEGRSMLLRTVTQGGIVGVANLFSEDDFVSRVIAAKHCETMEISPESYGKILESDKRAMYNYLAFLSEKIRYLNRKIVTLTAGSAERRLAYFLDTSIPDNATETPEITVPMNSLSEMLNLGRASLYRAADKLTEEGFITRDGKTIKIINRHGMMEKYR